MTLTMLRPLGSLLGARALGRMGGARLPLGARSLSSGRSDMFRNVAIVAHVDHGKTTMVDALLREDAGAAAGLTERAMDSNDLEKERGITILSKSTSIEFKGKRVNIVDTPGHSDFSGEVERVLSMVDGICLVVDATDGPMPQTKYVLSKALERDLRPIVVINKVDRPTARVSEVENEVFDLFCSMNASDDQLEYPTLYACGRDGWARTEMPEDAANVQGDMKPLLDTIVSEVPGPEVQDGKARMLVSIMESDPSVHLGKLLLTGRVYSGEIKPGQRVAVLNPDGNRVPGDSTVVKVFKRVGMTRVETDVGVAGDIVTVSGVLGGRVADTLCDLEAVEEGPLDGPTLDPATISMFFAVNDSPFAGHKDRSGGTKLTSQLIRERLEKETESNIAVQIAAKSVVVDGRDCIEVHGRGEMQLGILVENMRREGFELSVSPPRALFRKDDQGRILEPVEEVTIDVADELAGPVIEALVARKGDMMDSIPNEEGTRRKMVFTVPSRGMVGLRSEMTRATRGDVVVSSVFQGYEKYRGEMNSTRRGVLIASEDGPATEYALVALEARGELFVKPQDQVYMGMIVGEHSRGNDLDVNVAKTKKLTNMRAAGKDDTVRLSPVRSMMLEDYIGYVNDDELIEITPNNIRIRKSYLNPTARKGARKSRKVFVDEE